MNNPVLQFQIISKDPDAAANFYCTLFGWTVDADNPMGYRRLDTGSLEGIQGGIWPAPPQAPTFTQLFIAVGDMATSVRQAEQLGAKLLIPPTALPEGGQMAVLHDPQGMSFGLWQR